LNTVGSLPGGHWVFAICLTAFLSLAGCAPYTTAGNPGADLRTLPEKGEEPTGAAPGAPPSTAARRRPEQPRHQPSRRRRSPWRVGRPV